MTKSLQYYLKRLLALSIVFLLACLGFLASYLLRFDFEIPEYWLRQFFLHVPHVALIKVGVFWLLSARLSNWRYFSASSIFFVCLYAIVCSVLVFVLASFDSRPRIPRGVIIIDFLVTLSIGIGAGLIWKSASERIATGFDRSRKRAQRAVIVGISNATEAYIIETKRSPGANVQVEAIFDVDSSRKGSFIHGVPVKGSLEELRPYLAKSPVDMVLVSLDPSVQGTMKRINKLLKGFDVIVKPLRPMLESVDRSLPLSRLDVTGAYDVAAQNGGQGLPPRSERDPNFIPLVKPTLPEFEDVFWVVKQSYASGQVTSGDVVKLFEKELQRFTGVEHAIAVSSGTSGLMLVFSALDLPEGSEVIVPSFTFAATVHALLWNGLTPVFVDCLPGTMTVDPEEVSKALSPKTKAIYPVTVFGLPPDLDELEALSRKWDLPLICDSAQGLGASYKGRPLGGFGICEVFSLSPSKAITSMEGGVVTTNDPQLADKLRSMRNYGKASQGQEMVYMGLSARMVEIDAAVGLLNLRRAESLLANRLKLIGDYCERLKGIPGCSPQEFPTDRTSSGSLFAFRVGSEAVKSRDGLMKALRSKNIESKEYFSPPAHAHPLVSNRPHRIVGDLPVTWACSRECIALPLYSEMASEDHERVCAVVESILGTGYQGVVSPTLS
ncbi:MAG: aminotransferase class I/II-fold pyridoxal phosphate-dependent enzyme [Desulfomonile tiedjei]|nr:aminotransferase class I/II-fold pyridoxal phosphate-dependent enzyme [Desulfomonile tiedjei]